MIKPPKLSVGLPVYNGEKYLRQALDSLVGQDYEDFELIISDNASTDGTAEICREFAAREKKIRYLRSEINRGVTWNFQNVLEVAQGEYFKWAAHDDECYPTMFRRCVEVMDKADSSVMVVYPCFEFIDEEGAVIMQNVDPTWDRVETSASTPHQRLAHVIRRNFYGQAIYGIVRTKALRRATQFGRIAPDWIKLAELSVMGKILVVPEVLFRLRRHGGNSAEQYQQWQALLTWHDPNSKKRPPRISYTTAVTLEYFKAVRRLPLPAFEKLMCGAVALTLLPKRVIMSRLLRMSGPMRIRLQAITGWKWLSRVGASSK